MLRDNLTAKEFREFLGESAYEYFEALRKDTYENTKEFTDKMIPLYKGLLNIIEEADKYNRLLINFLEGLSKGEKS